MKRVGGTLGDAFILGCKARACGETHLVHYTKHKMLRPQIREVYKVLFPEIKVEFSKVNIGRDLTSVCLEHDMDYFPRLSTAQGLGRIVVPTAGHKLHRRVDIKTEEDDIILGQNPMDATLKGHNLVGQTTLDEALYYVVNATRFIGMEGLFAYVALSQRVPSAIFSTNFHSVRTRIIGTPWEKYATLV